MKFGYKKIFKKFPGYLPCNFVAIGDQIVTDVWGASRNGVKSILVKPIRLDNEKWYTRFNRKIERLIIEKIIKKKDYQKYQLILKIKENN